MKRLLKLSLVLILVVWVSSVFGSDFPKISIEAALKRAAVEDKNVLVYMTAKWCGPCKVMDKSVFPDSNLKKVVSKSYVAIEIDGESWRGERIMKEFNVTGFPTFLIVTPERRLQRKALGYMDVSKLIDFLQSGSNQDQFASHADRVASLRTIPQRVRPEFGVKLGIADASVSKTAGQSRVGYEFGSFLAFERGRLLLRPGLSVGARGSDDFKLTYLRLAVDFGLTVYRSAILKLPGGFRVLVSPYAGISLNSREEIEKNDYGLKYGAAAYIGETSKLEAGLSVEHGFRDINQLRAGAQNLRAIVLNISLTF